MRTSLLPTVVLAACIAALAAWNLVLAAKVAEVQHVQTEPAAAQAPLTAPAAAPVLTDEDSPEPSV